MVDPCGKEIRRACQCSSPMTSVYLEIEAGAPVWSESWRADGSVCNRGRKRSRGGKITLDMERLYDTTTHCSNLDFGHSDIFRVLDREIEGEKDVLFSPFSIFSNPASLLSLHPKHHFLCISVC